MTARRHGLSFAFGSLMLLGAVVIACAAPAPSGAPPTADGASSPPASERPEPTPIASASPAAALEPPTACLGLGAQDCARARAAALATLDAVDPAPRYVQVGPFGCAAAERCPTTLAARPEGDVAIDFGNGTGKDVHLKVAGDGSVQATSGPSLGIKVDASSAVGLPAGPVPYTLGHCGVFSGIDLDGSWWDPVGPVDIDHPASINSADGVITLTDPTHATFTTPTGFSLRLLRHDGPKLLPGCA